MNRLEKLILLVIFAATAFATGFVYQNAALIKNYGDQIVTAIKNLKPVNVQIVAPQKGSLPVTNKSVANQAIPSKRKVTNWSGPEFWAAITAKRQDQALSPIPVNELLCTLAAIRLAEIRRMGRLDDHDGFKPLIDKYKDDLNRDDLLNLFEFLTSGASTAKAAVDGLYDTLGHKALFTEIYKAGCAYAADGFGVVITSK